MKKIAKKAAVILVLAIFAGSFSGCFTMSAFNGSEDALMWLVAVPILPALDIITSPIQLAIFLVEMNRYAEYHEKVARMDRIDTFPAGISFIPDTEFFALREKLNSLPEEEIAAFKNTTASFSETEITAIVRAFNNLSEEEIVSSMETLNSMPDEMLIAALNNLQYTEFRYQ